MITNKRHSKISLRLTTAALAHLQQIAADCELKVSDLIRRSIREVYRLPNFPEEACDFQQAEKSK